MASSRPAPTARESVTMPIRLSDAAAQRAMGQHGTASPAADAAARSSAEELVAHERTYGGFTIFATGVTIHLAILLSSLALAFFGNAPVMAALWFVAGHVALIALLVRLTHAARAIGHASPVVVPLRR